MAETIKIYLSGGMSELSESEQSVWRSNIRNEILYGGHDINKDVDFFDPTTKYSIQYPCHKTEREHFEYDLWQLRHSGIVIVNFNKPDSIGTAMELMLAKELHIPIIGLNSNNVDIHPWLIECCNRVCDNMRELIEHATEFYLQ